MIDHENGICISEHHVFLMKEHKKISWHLLSKQKKKIPSINKIPPTQTVYVTKIY